MSKKYFTIEQANDLIPTLEFKLPKLLQVKKELAAYITSLVEKGINIEDLLAMTGVLDDELLGMKAALERLGLMLQGELADIQSLGCVVKDMDLGLIDFYAIMEGAEVFLCWQLGEKSIRYWHGVEEGFSNRRLLFGEEESKDNLLYH